MRLGRSWCLLVVALQIVLARAPASAAQSSAARKAYEEATAAFGLGRYAEAADRYEKAFSLHPDPALLYNAAQAFRLAGNSKRALELYRNYLRLYPDASNADEAR
ncbi:MAG TPA: tetratricopeptide repeat protein, partial [Polyangia bacterium]